MKLFNPLQLTLFVKTRAPSQRSILDMKNLIYRCPPSDYFSLTASLGSRDLTTTNQKDILHILNELSIAQDQAQVFELNSLPSGHDSRRF
jgi:hypothetical protein